MNKLGTGRGRCALANQLPEVVATAKKEKW
jgi:hypothetical protein